MSGKTLANHPLISVLGAKTKLTMKKFRKKPVVIEAVKWTGDNIPEMQAFTNINGIYEGTLMIRTLEGKMYASKGDWIIKGVEGEFYPCKPDIFEKTYEPVEDQ